MFSLVIKEKTGVVGGWLEVDGEEHVLKFGRYEEDLLRAVDTLTEWSNWMSEEISSVQTIYTERGGRLSIRPDMVESVALTYTRS